VKNSLEIIKKLIPFQQAVVLTSVPRGGLQIFQPARIPVGLVDAYAEGADKDDRLSWQSILKNKPVQPGDVGSREAFAGSAYSRELMLPEGLAHAVAFPLTAPIFQGYPGSLHLLRIEEQGAFSSSQISAVMSAIRAFEQRAAATRAPKKGSGDSALARAVSRPTALVVMDSKLKVLIGGEAWAGLDSHLKDQISEYAKRQFRQLGSGGVRADRAQFHDSQLSVWTYRIVTCKRYPALGDGPVCLICLQPTCDEWISLKASDFPADPEIARLIPALKFMRKAFRNGPNLVTIASMADLSAFHFHRRFTELLGLTPKQFMLDCQILEAKTDLILGKAELADIARDCGFAHQSHFTSRFKQATGHTPTRWRRVARARIKR
jgi:AraC-like DNA-binding protein